MHIITNKPNSNFILLQFQSNLNKIDPLHKTALLIAQLHPCGGAIKTKENWNTKSHSSILLLFFPFS